MINDFINYVKCIVNIFEINEEYIILKEMRAAGCSTWYYLYFLKSNDVAVILCRNSMSEHLWKKSDVTLRNWEYDENVSRISTIYYDKLKQYADKYK
jgi:hypothetical protein